MFNHIPRFKWELPLLALLFYNKNLRRAWDASPFTDGS